MSNFSKVKVSFLTGVWPVSAFHKWVEKGSSFLQKKVVINQLAKGKFFKETRQKKLNLLIQKFGMTKTLNTTFAFV